MADNDLRDAQGTTHTTDPRAREDTGRSGRPRRRAGQMAGAAAKGAGTSLVAGFAAVRDVRAASREHANARSRYKALKQELDEDKAEYDHRARIERDYERIRADETAEIAAANEAIAETDALIASITEEQESYRRQLDELREQNEEKLRPYRSLVDSTKGRADDAALALADARRAVKTSEAALNDAAKRRDQRISGANRAYDSAQERLRKVQGELEKLKDSDPSTSLNALPKLRDESVAAQARVDAAREDIDRITTESQQAVDNAQTHLWTQKKSLEMAETQAEQTKSEATASREEYDALYKEAQAQETNLEETIKERSRRINEAEKTRTTHEKRASDAQTVLDEAEAIHATPEVTAELRRKISQNQYELQRQNDELKDLARAEKQLRRSTRAARIVFFCILGAILLVVALIVWLLIPKPAPEASNTSTVPVQVQTQTSSGGTTTSSSSSSATTTTTGTTGGSSQQGTSSSTGGTTDGTTTGTSGSTTTGTTGGTTGSGSTTGATGSGTSSSAL